MSALQKRGSGGVGSKGLLKRTSRGGRDGNSVPGGEGEKKRDDALRTPPASPAVNRDKCAGSIRASSPSKRVLVRSVVEFAGKGGGTVGDELRAVQLEAERLVDELRRLYSELDGVEVSNEGIGVLVRRFEVG